jgi:hypothetical protein
MIELNEFVDELRAAGNAERAEDLAAFFDYWQQFHEHPAGAGAFAMEQTDAMRRIVRQKDRSVSARLAALDALMRSIKTEARTRAERARALAKIADRTA